MHFKRTTIPIPIATAMVTNLKGLLLAIFLPISTAPLAVFAIDLLFLMADPIAEAAAVHGLNLDELLEALNK